MTPTLATARLALRNAEAAYRFHAFEVDSQQAEYWCGRACHWRRLVQELEENEKPDGRGANNSRPLFFNTG